MANVITQIEMMKYSGMDRINFPAGTIVTPSAKDWAQEHNIQIIIGECCRENRESAGIDVKNTEKDLLLRQVIKSVADNMGEAGGFLSKDEFADAVAACLKRLGCRVDN